MATKGGGTPQQPDMRAAAEAMGRSSQEVIRQQTYANRPDIYTPWGSMTWDVEQVPGAEGAAPAGGAPGAPPPESEVPPSPYSSRGPGRPDVGDGRAVPASSIGSILDAVAGGIAGTRGAPVPGAGAGVGYGDVPLERWAQTVNLTPEQQAIFESQQATQFGRSQLAEDVLGQGAAELGRPVDWAGLAPRGESLQPGAAEEARRRAEEAIYGQATSRLDPRFQQEEQAITSQLYNQGLRPGDEAWDKAMGNFQRAKADAYQQAMYGAFTGGGAEAQRQLGLQTQAGQYQTQLRQSQLAEELQRRGYSLNEIQALLGGQQVSMPGFPGFTAAGAAQPTQYLPAAQAQFQAALAAQQSQQAGQQGMLSGLLGLGSIPFMF